MSGSAEQKRRLRQAVRQSGLRQDAMARAEESRKVLSRIEQDPHFIQAGTVLMFHPLQDEIQTEALLWRWASRKRVLLPRVEKDRLVLCQVQTAENLHRGAFGILEPSGAPFTDLDQIDVAIVPGMAFDSRGRRLGRGRGYYDRLLPLIPRAWRIGICHSWQLVQEVPSEPHDVVMDLVLSP